jgi:CheY-like chemotaxis protein
VSKVKEGKSNVEKNGNRTVMVVEDFRDARLMLKETLETKGYCVVEAADGWEGLCLTIR